MNKNRLHLLILFTLLGFWSTAQKTQVVYLSGTDAANTEEWSFYCTDGRNSGEWSTIPVPSNWELQNFGTYNYGHDWRNENIEIGKEKGLYKHEFDVPSQWKGKTVKIVFEGSMTDTRVTINGKLAGPVHQGAFYRFDYDISDLLKYGKSNLLEVEVAKHSENESVNKAERQADYWIFGGIFRPVYLEILPESHINRAAIDARGNGNFNTLIELNSPKRDFSVSMELFDMEGQKVGRTFREEISGKANQMNISGRVESVIPWNPEKPTLYDMEISLKKGGEIVHQVTERIGFRTVELREHDGFYVNGEKVVFKGVNRHSFWPETGRALSGENHLNDIKLIKEMNMNAVRMSHYPPDKRFLELCDSLGLFVINEVAGWQDGYDTEVGPKIIKSTVLDDENHPSVVIWCNGNEGGWDFANEKWFHHHDIQNRPVLYPWLLRNGMDLHHYPNYYYATGRYVNGNDPFMPTEFLHGLYDGGHGAGLEDYWNHYQSSPLHAGGILWVFTDEAVLRTDKKGKVYDSDGNHAPDGILGPHRQKEGSFYTIKEIWSPVQIDPVTISPNWNGELFLENKFIYTNLNECRFDWKAVKTGFRETREKVIAKGNTTSPNTLPGEKRAINLDVGNALEKADLFLFTATDHHGKEIYTWSWPVVQPDEKATQLLASLQKDESEITINETSEAVTAISGPIEISFSKADGTLLSVKNKNGNISLTGGPVPVGVDSKITDTSWEKQPDGSFIFEIHNDPFPRKTTWKLNPNGLLMLEARHPQQGMWGYDYLGISFNYPEEKCTGVQWMGSGPYRVWKNRLKGTTMGVWEKDYNNTITGERFNNLIYPEFKGYHANLYWAELKTKESPVTIISETPNLYFRLFTPEKPQDAKGGTYPDFPDGDISFLYEIPAIGTKFKSADQLGPGSQQGTYGGHKGDRGYPFKLWFDFRSR